MITIWRHISAAKVHSESSYRPWDGFINQWTILKSCTCGICRLSRCISCRTLIITKSLSYPHLGKTEKALNKQPQVKLTTKIACQLAPLFLGVCALLIIIIIKNMGNNTCYLIRHNIITHTKVAMKRVSRARHRGLLSYRSVSRSTDNDSNDDQLHSLHQWPQMAIKEAPQSLWFQVLPFLFFCLSVCVCDTIGANLNWK